MVERELCFSYAYASFYCYDSFEYEYSIFTNMFYNEIKTRKIKKKLVTQDEKFNI